MIRRDGFKVVLLLRLSPLFPFAIINYLCGVTAVDFWYITTTDFLPPTTHSFPLYFRSYLLASVIGFLPGTLVIVYTGSMGKVILFILLPQYVGLWFHMLPSFSVVVATGRCCRSTYILFTGSAVTLWIRSYRFTCPLSCIWNWQGILSREGYTIPAYVYVCVAALIALGARTIGKIAQNMIKAMEEENAGRLDDNSWM